MAKPMKKPKEAPKSSEKKLVRKKCKTPRGAKTAKVINQLLDAVQTPIKRHRNNYNHQMAQVSRLARML